MNKNSRACKSHRMNFDFNVINDLLLQIFYRLPCFESVIRCKCVCKHWFNLVSEPGFGARFIAHRINNGHLSNNTKSNLEEENVFLIYRKNQKPFVYPTHPSFTSHDFSLSFIPTYEGGAENPIIVRAWCNDLVLCHSPASKELDLFICNPRTKQYLQLPPPSQKNQVSCLIGFALDPSYVFDNEAGQVNLSTSCRYSVCYAGLGISPAIRLEIEIFSSETRVWRKAVLLTPKYFSYPHAMFKNCFTYKGMLHFYSQDAIIGFDPYKIKEDGVIRAHFIQMPPFDETSVHLRTVCIGVFGEKILLAEYCARYIVVGRDVIDMDQVSIEPRNTDYSIKVWELMDYDTGEWSMKHMIYLQDLVSQDSVPTEHIKRGCPNSGVLYFRLNDADTLLLKLPKQVVECNLKEKTLKPVCRFHLLQRVYSLTSLWWPSPLPLIM